MGRALNRLFNIPDMEHKMWMVQFVDHIYDIIKCQKDRGTHQNSVRTIQKRAWGGMGRHGEAPHRMGRLKK